MENDRLTTDDGIDYLSCAVSDKVNLLVAEPALALATKKISEIWPHRTFTRITPNFYILDGFVFVEGTPYKVKIESGTKGTVIVSAYKDKTFGVVVNCKLDKYFPEKFTDMVAEAIVKINAYE